MLQNEKLTPARCILEDGTIFSGLAFGAIGSRGGEVVFNTSMTGYQEILTDPSYAGQIVVMTYPLIGNYGTNEIDLESSRPWVEGFIVKEPSQIASNFRANQTLDEYFKEHNIIGFCNVDTRAITRKIRLQGAMRGYITTDQTISDEELLEYVLNIPEMKGQDLVQKVKPSKPYKWTDGFITDFDPKRNKTKKFKVAVIDCGIKHNILRHLIDTGCELTVFPPTSSADEILKFNPDGLFVSNGPGDPEPVKYVQETIKALIGKLPIFGICLGHQLIALALGAKTFKLKFGHHGGNQPVRNIYTGRVEITAQNHGFAVDPDTMEQANIKLTHINLNDQTVEGFTHKELPIMAVQYHPENSPGPHDATYLFDLFTEMIKSQKPPTGKEFKKIQK